MTKKFCPECGQPTKKKTFVHFVLDQSSSMSSVKAATISGFNEYLNTLKKDGNEYAVSLTLFNENVERTFANLALGEVKELTESSYNPSGMTALYDAVCETLDGSDQEGKHIVVIMTDGEENSSRRFNQQDLKKKIEKLQSSGNWTFVYLGANQDSWATAQQFGVYRNNIANYNSTQQGTRSAFVMSASNTSAFAGSDILATADFFSKDDQDTLMKTK